VVVAGRNKKCLPGGQARQVVAGKFLYSVVRINRQGSIIDIVDTIRTEIVRASFFSRMA
jgi:hypothetical protein